MAGKDLTKMQGEVLRDVLRFDRSGYYIEWKPKTVAKLCAMGLVARSGAGHRITPAGRAALRNHEEGQ